MKKMVFAVVAVMLGVCPARAEWMSIGGGLGGGDSSSGQQAAPQKPAGSSSGGLWGGSGSGSSSGNGSSTGQGTSSGGGSSWSLGGTGSSGNSSGTGSSGSPAGSSSSTSDAGVDIVYTGQAHMDNRPATLRMNIVGNQVSGTLEIGSICQTNVHLGGASITFSGTLSGEWESKSGEINATWQGKDHVCGEDVANNGVFKVFLKDENTVHLRINGQRGQYGYDLKPHRKVYANGSAAVAGNGGSSGTQTTPTKPTKPEAPVSGDELNPDDVDSIMALPSVMTLPPGGDMEFPLVYVVMAADGEKRLVDDSSVKWTLPGGVTKKDGRIVVGASVADGEKLTLVGRMDIGGERFETKLVITVREGEKLGTYSGRVMFDYSPFRSLKDGKSPVSPAWAEVELRYRLGSAGVFARTRTGPDGNFVFRNVPKGFYQAWAVKIATTAFPEGYELDAPNGPWTYDWGDVPEMRWSEDEGKEVEVWEVAHKSLSIKVSQPKDGQGSTAGRLYGRVTRDGVGVSGVAILVDMDGGGQHYETTSGADGAYSLDLSEAVAGRYWVRAEKYITKGWARCGDLLDLASNRDQASNVISAPPDSLGERLDIPVATRGEIFGACTDEDPVELPGRSRFQGVGARSWDEGW